VPLDGTEGMGLDQVRKRVSAWYCTVGCMSAGKASDGVNILGVIRPG